METIDLSNVRMNRDDPRNFTHWLVIHALADLRNESPDAKKAWDAIKINALEIEFKIQGIAVPFERTLHGIEQQLDRMIEENAKAMVAERCGDLIDAIEVFKDEFRRRTREIFPLAREED